ncbi:hypothetical protein EAI_12879 [Harpegnathos saltator]|uniref:Uncharacterized protein n=1 Tax=Harpegnathos saltator TaxID=610380 RepID=E2BWE9_HARSA|nr:hypothetical protein EAI_12879 [Harpegnathos saltator]
MRKDIQFFKVRSISYIIIYIFIVVLLQEKDKPNSTTMNGSPGNAGMGDQMGVKIEPAEAESLSMSGSSGILTPVSPYACVKPPTPTPISPEQDELINRLVSFQCDFEQPSEEDLKRITYSVVEALRIGKESFALSCPFSATSGRDTSPYRCPTRCSGASMSLLSGGGGGGGSMPVPAPRPRSPRRCLCFQAYASGSGSGAALDPPPVGGPSPPFLCANSSIQMLK